MKFLIMKSLRESSCLLLQNKLIMDLDDSPLLWLPNFLSKVLSSYSRLQEDESTNSSKVLISMKLPKRCHNTTLPPTPPPTIKPQFIFHSRENSVNQPKGYFEYVGAFMPYMPLCCRCPYAVGTLML
jgi:hypothetical protein